MVLGLIGVMVSVLPFAMEAPKPGPEVAQIHLLPMEAIIAQLEILLQKMWTATHKHVQVLKFTLIISLTENKAMIYDSIMFPS